MVGAKPFKRPIQITVHISIIGVALVDDDYLARQPQMPQHHMALHQRRHQQLVDRTDDKV